MTSTEVRDRLAEKFNPRVIKFKPQVTRGNQALAAAYIDARDVMERLDEAVGPENWKTDFLQVGPKSVECRLSIKINGEWVCKADVGATSDQPDEGDKMKAAYSDALKRVAVVWGVGRYLYDLPLQWADYDQQKKRFVNTPQLPQWALPNGSNGVRQPQPQPQPQPMAMRQPAPQPQPQATPTPQPQSAPPQSEADAMLKMVSECRTAAELEANCFVADVKVKQGVLGGADLGRVQEAWVERALLVLEHTKTEEKLKQVSALFARCFRDACRMSDVQYKRIADKVASKFASFDQPPAGGGDEQPW